MRARAENQKVVLETTDSQRLDILGFHQPLPNACTDERKVVTLRRDLEADVVVANRIDGSCAPSAQLERGRCSRR